MTMKNDQPEIQIEMDEAAARGVYTNLAFISHSETEFLLDFTFLQPQTPKARVHTRIISSPIHAKRLLWALQDNLAKYEARFGKVTAGEDPGTAPKPAGFYQ